MASEHSKACCTLPMARAGPYDAKGRYEDIGGLRTYLTGPTDAKKCIFVVYDIFGLHSHTLQGADTLADGTYLVAVPDFFEGQPADLAWFPPDTEEKQGKMQKFFTDVASVPKIVPKVHRSVAALRQKYPTIDNVSAMGYCFGAKVVAVSSGEGTPFKSAVQTSPAYVDPDDASKATIPMAMLATKDEDAAVVKKYGESLKVSKRIEIFDKDIHGFMSARANLDNEVERKSYTHGYEIALEFFKQHA